MVGHMESSQLVRFCDFNSAMNSFYQDIKSMISKLDKQGFMHKIMLGTFQRFASRYLYKWAKYGLDVIPKVCSLLD